MNLLFITMFGIRKIIKYYLHSDIKIYFFHIKDMVLRLLKNIPNSLKESYLVINHII